MNPAHLFLGTRADNVHDMDNKGRRTILRGINHGMSKLTDSIVLNIFREKALGIKTKDLASKYLVTEVTINRVLRRDSWRHVNVKDR